MTEKDVADYGYWHTRCIEAENNVTVRELRIKQLEHQLDRMKIEFQALLDLWNDVCPIQPIACQKRGVLKGGGDKDPWRICDHCKKKPSTHFLQKDTYLCNDCYKTMKENCLL